MNDEDVINAIRRELRKVTDLLVDPETIVQVLRQDVIKREALEGEEAAEAQWVVLRRAKAALRVSRGGSGDAKTQVDADREMGGPLAEVAG